MDTALPQKFSFILDRNLAKANCTENHVCTSCDTVVLGYSLLKTFLNILGSPRGAPYREGHHLILIVYYRYFAQ